MDILLEVVNMEDGVDLPSWGQIHLVGHWQYHSAYHEGSNPPSPNFHWQVWVVIPQICCTEDHFITDLVLL